MKPIVQISLDLTNIDEALETAALAMRAGVDWLEAGTPLILAEGLHGVRALRKAFPNTPIVADLKTMDGGYLEAEMMAKAGATHVVVMARAHAYPVKVEGRYVMDPSPTPKFDNPKMDDCAALQLFGAGREKRIYAVPPHCSVVSLDFEDHPFEPTKFDHACALCDATPAIKRQFEYFGECLIL